MILRHSHIVFLLFLVLVFDSDLHEASFWDVVRQVFHQFANDFVHVVEADVLHGVDCLASKEQSAFDKVFR